MVDYAIRRLKKELRFFPDGHVGNIQGENYKLYILMIPLSITIGFIWTWINIQTNSLNMYFAPIVGLFIGIVVKYQVRGESFKYRIISSLYNFIPLWMACAITLNYKEYIKGYLLKGKLCSISYISKFILTQNEHIFIIIGLVLAASVATYDYK